MFKQTIALLGITLSISGCASIVNGTAQPVSVTTGHIKGASCSLENDKGRWYVNQTPGSVIINRSYNDLRINCHKSYYKGYRIVASKTKAMAFGNAIFGGVIGAGVDIVDGAAYDYPSEVYVPLAKARASA